MVEDNAGACIVLPADLVIGYGRGEVSGTAAWSVEAHLPGCPDCRSVLARCGQAERLELNRKVLLARAGLPTGPVARALQLCGVPEHITVLLSATPSLRRSWFTGVALLLGASVGVAQLAAVATRTGPSPAGAISWAGLVPFLCLAPLLPLAAVAAAFSSGLDPAFALANAAPVSKAWLLLVRSVAVIGGTLLPTVVAAMALPGPWWLPIAVLLPSLAVCSAALAAATVTAPLRAVVFAATGWIVAVAVAGQAAGRPALLYGRDGQLAALAVLIAATVLVAARRRQIDIGWMR